MTDTEGLAQPNLLPSSIPLSVKRQQNGTFNCQNNQVGFLVQLLMHVQNLLNQYLPIIIYCIVTHIIHLPLRIHMRCLSTELDGVSHADTPAHLQQCKDNLTLIALAAG